MSLSIAARREESPWSCKDNEAILVLAPASPRLNRAGTVIVLMGSHFCLSTSWSQCEYITSSEWYRIFGITVTRTHNFWLWLKIKHGVSPVCEQTHHLSTFGTSQFLPGKLILPIVWAQREVLYLGTVPKQTPYPHTSSIVRPILCSSHQHWGGLGSEDKL